MERIYICIPTRNEEKNLDECLFSIERALKNLKGYIAETFICLNGCKDSCEKIANSCSKKYLSLNLKILKSKTGKLNAQQKIISNISNNKKIFFIDSDIQIDVNSLKIILDEFRKHKELLAVGALPMAKNYSGKNPWKKFLDKVLNIRSRNPKCEISKLDVRKYHLLAKKDPQTINTSKNHELKSKIFFHGRMFALRSKKYWNRPDKNKKVVGDDSYLPDYIIYNYGKNKIRIRYDALVYFNPFISLSKHYKTYKRIYFDLKNLRDNFPKFRDIRDHSELILDKDYIKNQGILKKFYFSCFKLIRKIEKSLFRISLERDPYKIWKNS